MKKKNTKIIIKGPSVLKGAVKISGSKNAVLPILAATLITDEKCIIRNVPNLTDIDIMISIISLLGKKVIRKKSFLIVESGGKISSEVPYELVRKLRASVLVIGALAGRINKFKVSLPGGCAIGIRPIDIHLKGLEKMGVSFKVSGGFVNLVSNGLKACRICLDYPSVGATENLILAACHAKGKTIIENISQEPEVIQMIEFLKKMGAYIECNGNTVIISGKKQLKSVDFSVMDDRIQAGTYLLAGCIKNSEIKILFSHPHTLDSLISKLKDIGAHIKVSSKSILIKGPTHPVSCEVRTAPYPGFPTDLQAPLIAILTKVKGVSVITEEVFENRFLHCPEFLRMGADIEIKGNSAIITGKNSLSGAQVEALDLRGGASLIIAGLQARGKTEISGMEHIERGYENIVDNFKKLGANIWME